MSKATEIAKKCSLCNKEKVIVFLKEGIYMCEYCDKPDFKLNASHVIENLNVYKTLIGGLNTEKSRDKAQDAPVVKSSSQEDETERFKRQLREMTDFIDIDPDELRKFL